MATTTFIKINNTLYPASINGTNRDSMWDNRKSKEIILTMTYEEAINLFVDGLEWSIVYQGPDYIDEEGKTITPEPIEYDNSDYDLAGPITDNRNGTISVKMGMLTDSEALMALREALSL